MSSNTKESKIKISGIITAIFLIPILEKILSPAYDTVINWAFSTSNVWLQVISSLFYSRISEGVYINIPFYIFIVIVGSLLIKLIVPPKPSTTCGDENMDCCQKEPPCILSKRIKCLFIYSIQQKPFKIFICITLYVLFILFILTTNFINKTITRTTNNIEIVAPYIDDYDYKCLKSNFHSMNSLSDFNDLNDKLEEYARKANLTLK